jgi:hypothetical protein
VDVRMGQPTQRWVSVHQSIVGGGEPGELKHLSTRRNRHQHEIPRVVASESGAGQWPPRGKQNGLERPAAAGDSPVCVKSWRSLSKAGHVKSCLKTGGPPSKPKYSLVTDSGRVP